MADLTPFRDTHPDGAAFASGCYEIINGREVFKGDQGVLQLLQKAGSPQRTSTIIPLERSDGVKAPPFKFSVEDSNLDYGISNGAIVPRRQFIMSSLIVDNPIDFDVWCRIEDGSQKLVADWTANMNSQYIIDAFKIFRESIKIDGYIQIFMRCGWDDIPGLLLKLPDFVQRDTLIITESSYRPSDCPRYCEIHSLRYVAQLCPVCNGFYISNVINGKRFVASKN